MADTKLHLDEIRTDGGTQPRDKIDDEVVQRYVEALKAKATFPPIVVYYDGEDYWLADGFHRLKAYRELKRQKVAVEIHQGSRREAILHAVGANAEHGLPRTREDVRRAIDTLLRDPEWSQWSDREIARWCKVHHSTVSARRRNFVTNQETNEESSNVTSNRSLANLASEKTSGLPPETSGEGQPGQTVKRRYRTRHGTISEMQVPVRPRTSTSNGADQAQPTNDFSDADSDTGEAETDSADAPPYDLTPLIEQARRLADGDENARPESDEVALELSRLTGTAVMTQEFGFRVFGERDYYEPEHYEVGGTTPTAGEIWFRFSAMLQESVFTMRHADPAKCVHLTPLEAKREARDLLTYIGAWYARALEELNRTYRDPDTLDPDDANVKRLDMFGLRHFPLTDEDWERVRRRQATIAKKITNQGEIEPE